VGARDANGRGGYVVLRSSLGRTALRPIGTVLASQDADSAIRKAGITQTQPSRMSTTTIDQLRDRIQQDLAQLRSTMEQAKGLIGSIQSVVRGNDDNIRETIGNLRIASAHLAQLTDHVNHQPWSLVRIRQPKDRKVPE
jgi:hypothetical protein